MTSSVSGNELECGERVSPAFSEEPKHVAKKVRHNLYLAKIADLEDGSRGWWKQMKLLMGSSPRAKASCKAMADGNMRLLVTRQLPSMSSWAL